MRQLAGVLLGAVAGVGLIASPVFAGAVGNHLKCYKAKETAGPGKFQATADLLSTVGLAPELGCTIKGPPKMFCGPVGKVNVAPTPPGGGPQNGTSKFVCYKVKCAKGAEQTATGKDQFGTHTFTLKTPKILCAPASPSGAFLDDAPAS